MAFEYTKFDNLEREYRQLLGRKSTLMRMIKRRNEMLAPLLKEVNKLKDEIKPLEEELGSLKSKIKGIAVGERWEPPIVITKVKNVKGYDYLRGKIRFGGKEKVKMIPKNEELKTIREIKSDVKNINITDEELKGVLYGKLREWVLVWWREKGILEKK
jgi:DNA repair exonuclease SbcCD ATPase subunit